MTTIPAPALAQQLFERGTVHKNAEFDWRLVFAAALFLAVAIVELSIIVAAAPSGDVRPLTSGYRTHPL